MALEWGRDLMLSHPRLFLTMAEEPSRWFGYGTDIDRTLEKAKATAAGTNMLENENPHFDPNFILEI